MIVDQTGVLFFGTPGIALQYINHAFLVLIAKSNYHRI